MGFYDYLDENEVKCFNSPVMVLNKSSDGDKEQFNIFSYSGSFRNILKGQKVPYKTLCYNYGKDFMIFDYRTFDFNAEDFKTDRLQIHIIRDGCYYKSVPFDKLSKSYKIGLVLDNYGEILNIHTVEDFKKIVYDWRYYQKEFARLNDEFLKSLGVKNGLFQAMGTITPEEFDDITKKYSKVSNENYNHTLLKFRETWYNIDENSRMEVFGGWVIGGLYDSYLKKYNLEEDWYKILPMLNEHLKEIRNTDLFYELGAYSVWCSKNKIDIDLNSLFKFVVKYLNTK